MSGLRSTCAHCGEPVVKVESPFDNIWRWRHEIIGVIRTHIATPAHVCGSADHA